MARSSEKKAATCKWSTSMFIIMNSLQWNYSKTLVENYTLFCLFVPYSNQQHFNSLQFVFFSICHFFSSWTSTKIKVRAEVINFYKPFLLSCNGLYVLLRWYMIGSIVSFQSVIHCIQSVFIMLLLFGLQYYSYLGIIEDASNPKRNKKEYLAGGAHLDLLGFVLFVQFGSIILTTKLYYLLLIIPVWGMWSLYNTFYGTTKNSNK